MKTIGSVQIRNALLILVILVLLGLVGLLLPGGSDWYEVIRPATLRLLAGQSPYAQPFWYSPIWILLPFIPMALFPPMIGRAILFIVSVCAYTYCIHKMGARIPAVIAFLLSPPIVFALWLNSTDWIPFIGFILPPQIGLFFLSAKPQLGLVVAVYWFIESGRKGWREILRVFGPISLAMVILFAIYGTKPFFSGARLVGIEHNASLWPMSLPLGLGLTVAALRKRDMRYAIAAGPCLSPYVMMTSWAAIYIAISRFTYELIAGVIGAWILVVIQAGIKIPWPIQ